MTTGVSITHLSVKGENGVTLCDRPVERLWDRALFGAGEIGILLNQKEDHNVCKPCLETLGRLVCRLQQIGFQLSWIAPSPLLGGTVDAEESKVALAAGLAFHYRDALRACIDEIGSEGGDVEMAHMRAKEALEETPLEPRELSTLAARVIDEVNPDLWFIAAQELNEGGGLR